MKNNVESFENEADELRKDIIMALEELHARPSVEEIARPTKVITPAPRSRKELVVRRVAIGWIFLGGLGCLAAADIALASNDEPTKSDTQVGSIQVDYDVPVWVDPELGE